MTRSGVTISNNKKAVSSYLQVSRLLIRDGWGTTSTMDLIHTSIQGVELGTVISEVCKGFV
jgi:hypothetical protein